MYWGETALAYQTAISGDDIGRLQLAQSLAQADYNHPECETASTRFDQRSFCFQHAKVTPKSFLLIHGFTACPYEMLELGQRLFTAGHNVFGVRLAGHGTNTADFAKYNANDRKRSTQNGLRIALLLGREVVVIGESMGGTLAAILAETFPNLVSKLVLCAPAFLIANPLAYLTKWAIIRQLIPQNDMGVLDEWQLNYWYRMIPTSGVGELVKLAQEGYRAGPRIKAPTLIIQAYNDTIIRYQGSSHFHQTLKPETKLQSKLILFEGGHHNLTIDLNPRKQEVFQWINEFLK